MNWFKRLLQRLSRKALKETTNPMDENFNVKAWLRESKRLSEQSPELDGFFTEDCAPVQEILANQQAYQEQRRKEKEAAQIEASRRVS